MTLVLVGIGILGAVLSLFYLKDRLRNPTLARIAYSEPLMRITVVAVALIAVGILMMLSALFS